MGKTMKKTKICLRTTGPEQSEEIIAQADCVFSEKGNVYTFAEAGVRYTVTVGRAASIAREGEISYFLLLSEKGEVPAEMKTPYGTIPFFVRSHGIALSANAGRTVFEAEYSLVFSGEERRHKILFEADAPADENAFTENRK